MPGAGGKEVGRISIRVVPNLDQFRRDLKAELVAIEREFSATIPVNLDVDSAGAKAQLKAALTQMQAMAKASPVNIPVKMDRKGQLTNTLGKMTRDVENVGKAAEFTGTQFLGMTRMGWLTAAVFAAAAPAVALVSGLLAGLPSLMTAFGVGAGAVALGMDGIKAAFEGVRPALDELKAAVSDTFQQALTPIFEQFLPLLPMLKAGFQQVAIGLSGMFGGVADAVTSVEGMQMLSNILRDTGAFFQALGPVLNSFTTSFLKLSQAGAGAFGTLVGALSNFADQWGAMVDRVTSNGVFEQAMTGLSQTLVGLTSAFTRLFEAGLVSMGQLGGPISNMLGGLTDLLVSMMPALTSLSGLIGNVLGALGSSLAPVITALTPAFTQLANVLGSVLSSSLQTISPLITQIAQAFGDFLLGALTAITPYIPQLMGQFQQLTNILVTQLGPMLPQLVQSFIQLVPPLVQLIPPSIQLIQALLPLAPIFIAIVQGVVNMITNFVQLLSLFLNAGAAVAGFIGELATLSSNFFNFGGIDVFVEIIRNGISDAWNSFKTGVTNIVSEVAQMGTKIVTACAGFGSLLVSAGKDLIQGLINGITSMIGAAVDAARGVGRAIVSGVKGLLGINSPSVVFQGLGENVGQGFANGIENTQDDAVAKIKAVAKAVLEAVKEVFGSANGLNLAFNFGAVADSMSSLAGSAKQFQSSMQGVNTATGVPGLSTPQNVADAKEQLKVLQQQNLELEMQRKQLELSKLNATDAGKQVIKDQLEQIRQQKLQIGLQMDQLNYAQKYGDQVGQTNEMYQDMFQKAANMPKDFANATITQFTSDIGISGNGALSTMAKTAVDWGSKFIFNVANMDDALMAKDREVTKQSLSYT